MEFNFRAYKGETLHNVVVSYKIDGVRAHRTSEGVLSRAGKPLYNVTLHCDVAEVFCGTWEETVSRVRTHLGTPVFDECIYSLNPIDPRLVVGTYTILTEEDVTKLFSKATALGYEGLVLHTDTYLYKVKAVEHYDVPVLSLCEGKGRNKGKLGAVMTPLGKVGVGFSDDERTSFFNDDFIGTVIEVECMSLTPSGKFRHARYVRSRFDKGGT